MNTEDSLRQHGKVWGRLAAAASIALVLAPGPRWTGAEQASVTVHVTAEINGVAPLSLTLCDDPNCGEVTATAAPRLASAPAIAVEAGGPWVGVLDAGGNGAAGAGTWATGDAGKTLHRVPRPPHEPAAGARLITVLTVVVMR